LRKYTYNGGLNLLNFSAEWNDTAIFAGVKSNLQINANSFNSLNCTKTRSRVNNYAISY
jgi:hypothetical protein